MSTDANAAIRAQIWEQLADYRTAYCRASEYTRLVLRLDWGTYWADSLIQYYKAVADGEPRAAQTYWILRGEAWITMTQWAESLEAQEEGILQ